MRGRALSPASEEETAAWFRHADSALAYPVVSGAAFLDIAAVVIDRSFSLALPTRLIAATALALKNYS